MRAFNLPLVAIIAAMFVAVVALPAYAQVGVPGFCVKAITLIGVYSGTVTPTSAVCTQNSNSIAITATANDGYAFNSWDLPNGCYFAAGYSNTASTQIVCTAGALPYPEYNATATFVAVTTTTTLPTTTVQPNQFCANATLYQPNQGGSAYPAAYVCANAGQSISISAVPASGYGFSSWFLPVGCSYASGYGNSASTRVTCTASAYPYLNYIIAVGFIPITTTVQPTTTAQGPQFCVNSTLYTNNNGGTVTPRYYYCANSGQTVYVSATPAYGYAFGGWYLPNGCAFASGWGNTQATYVTCATGPAQTTRYTLAAQFTSTTSPEFCVNATVFSGAPGARASPSSYSCVFSGQAVVISASPAPGYTFTGWYLPSGCSYASGYSNTVTTQVTCSAGSPFPRYTVSAAFSYTPSSTTATVTLSPGWNLFSVPLANATTLSTTCSSSELLSPIWQFTNGAYSRATSIRGGYGYWLQSSAQCSITFVGAPLTITSLPYIGAGWNLIGGLNTSSSFTKILGGCDVTNGPLGFNTASNSYFNSSQIVPGAGYFIDVSAACSLGTGSSPPAPPTI